MYYKEWEWKIAVIIFSVILIIAGPISWYYETQIVSYVTGKVTDQYIKRTGYGRSASDHFHIVVEMDDGFQEIFWNDDSFFNWKFDSADLNQQIKIGKSYTFKVYGYRVPLLSIFRNIIEVKPLD